MPKSITLSAADMADVKPIESATAPTTPAPEPITLSDADMADVQPIDDSNSKVSDGQELADLNEAASKAPAATASRQTDVTDPMSGQVVGQAPDTSSPSDKPGDVGTFASNALNTLGFNALPAVGGAMNKLYGEKDAYGNAPEYRAEINRINRRSEEADQEHPYASLGGKAAGVLASLAAPIPAVGAGASLGEKLVHAGAVGLGYGAAGGAGEALGEGKGPLDVAKSAGAGALGGAALGLAGHAAVEGLGHLGGKAAGAFTQRALEKRIIGQGVSDIVGTNDPLISTATRTDKKKLLTALNLGKTDEEAGAGGKELLEKTGQAISDLARNDPEAAQKLLTTTTRALHNEVDSDWRLVDKASGGFDIGELKADLLKKIEQEKRPGNTSSSKQYEKFHHEIEELWARPVLEKRLAAAAEGDPRADLEITQNAPLKLPFRTLRQFVTDVQQAADNTLGGLSETERASMRREAYSTVKSFMDKQLDEVAANPKKGVFVQGRAANGGAVTATSITPELVKQSVDKIRANNRRVFALLSMEDSLKTRAIKTETMGMNPVARQGYMHRAASTVVEPMLSGVRSADRALSRLALANLQNSDVSIPALIDAALKSGATQAAIDAALKLKPGKDQK